MKHRAPSLNMVEKAVIANQWRSTVATARIHAIIGEDGIEFANQAGKVLYVVLGACRELGLAADHPDIRIVRGAINALEQQAECAEVIPELRAPILSGLEAAARLVAQFEHPVIVRAACDLHLKLKHQDINYSDFVAVAHGN